jgi:SAM-dependent methyltransferase
MRLQTEASAKADPTRDARAALDDLTASTRQKRKRHFLEYARAEIDFDRFAALWARHLASPDTLYMSKYLDLVYYLDRNYRQAIAYGLHKKQGLAILDLGCGPGYFAFAARYFCHHPVGVDLPGHALNDDMNALLGTVKLDHRIAPMMPLPIRGFDLVTALSAGFHRKADNTPFTEAEWRFLLDDLVSRLRPAGSIRMKLNPLRGSIGTGLPNEAFARLVAAYGGVFDPETRILSIQT